MTLKTNNPFAPMLAIEIGGDSKTRVLDFYLKDHNWGISQKVDGKRIVVLCGDNDMKIFNRKGEEIDGKFPDALRDDLSRLGHGYLLDGELVEDKYVVFDLIHSPENLKITPDTPFQKRYEMLEMVFDFWQPTQADILPFISLKESDLIPDLTEFLAGSDFRPIALQKKKYFDNLSNSGAEGAIFRSIESLYKFGQRSAGLLKWKFWKTADCIAYNPGREGKRSVSLALLEDGNPVDVGAVTVTESVLASIEPGQVLEVKYLYATESRRLYQSALLRIRDDKTADECDISQLQYTNRKVVLP